MDIAFSPHRTGTYAVVLYSPTEKVYFHFGTKEQARKAILKVESLKLTTEIKSALKKLSGEDYYCPSEESTRRWDSWESQSKGTHSS